MDRVNAVREHPLYREYYERLEKLEGRDGEKWRSVTGYLLTFVIGLVVSYIFSLIGM